MAAYLCAALHKACGRGFFLGQDAREKSAVCSAMMQFLRQINYLLQCIIVVDVLIYAVRQINYYLATLVYRTSYLSGPAPSRCHTFPHGPRFRYAPRPRILRETAMLRTFAAACILALTVTAAQAENPAVRVSVDVSYRGLNLFLIRRCQNPRRSSAGRRCRSAPSRAIRNAECMRSAIRTPSPAFKASWKTMSTTAWAAADAPHE